MRVSLIRTYTSLRLRCTKASGRLQDGSTAHGGPFQRKRRCIFGVRKGAANYKDTSCLDLFGIWVLVRVKARGTHSKKMPKIEGRVRIMYGGSGILVAEKQLGTNGLYYVMVSALVIASLYSILAIVVLTRTSQSCQVLPNTITRTRLKRST